jgi:hypothetical protein
MEKKAYESPRLETFGTVADLTLHGCTTAGGDAQTCRDGDYGSVITPGAG